MMDPHSNLSLINLYAMFYPKVSINILNFAGKLGIHFEV
jgi:hypothetical protein